MECQELFPRCSLANVVRNIITIWGFSFSSNHSCQKILGAVLDDVAGGFVRVLCTIDVSLLTLHVVQPREIDLEDPKAQNTFLTNESSAAQISYQQSIWLCTANDASYNDVIIHHIMMNHIMVILHNS